MVIKNCEYCGKEFESKPSANRKYCCRECSSLAKKGVPQPKRVDKIEVKCAICGKTELVLPSRAKNYLCCSVECLAKYNSERYSKKIECVCPICGKIFKLKPYYYNRAKTHCCSVECAAKLKETTYVGENNHQFGLTGELNSSFKGYKTIRKNNHLSDVFVYCPNHPDAKSGNRITEHRHLVLQNSENFNSAFFDKKDNYTIFKPNIIVHHIDRQHDNNEISNLIPLTKSQHSVLHGLLSDLTNVYFDEIIAVVKRGELLENHGDDNQQPSLNSNVFEGSETNGRILNKDSNTNTSAVLNSINSIIDDYIVQTRKITRDCYEQSIKEILESEIKSSEVITNEL